MSSILSAISGQFSKSLILGTFMPVALFVFLNLLFVVALFPGNQQLTQHVADINTREVLIVTLVTIVMTGLLYNLNAPVVRFYEGYTWEHSRLGRYLKLQYARQLRGLNELRPRLQDLGTAIESRPDVQAGVGQQSTIASRIQILRAIRNQIGLKANKEFPLSPASVLPTRLGNLIRSFEHYPQRQYNMAAITLYPRLIAVIDKEYLSQIDNAKTSFDFMINCSALSAILALTILFVGAFYPVTMSALHLALKWLVTIFFFLFLSWGFYLSAIGRASEWGDLVKGAFDLYRWKLLEQLGYKKVPASMEEERALWGSISAQMIYGDRPTADLPEYVRSDSAARGKPDRVKIETTRGISLTDSEHVIEVTLVAKNVDKERRTARNVVLTETVPIEYEYLWNTGKLIRNACNPMNASHPRAPNPTVSNEENAIISGINPYRFEIGTMIHEQAVTITYNALRRKT